MVNFALKLQDINSKAPWEMPLSYQIEEISWEIILQTLAVNKVCQLQNIVYNTPVTVKPLI